MSRLAQLRRSVRTRLGIPISDQFQTDDVIDEHINIAIQTIEQEARWPWQETVHEVEITDTTGDFAVRVDWKASRTIIHDGTQVPIVSPVDALTYSSTGVGPPQVATIVDRTVKLRPRPAVGTLLNHVYYRTPTLLQSDEDEPQMPTEYTPAIIAKAAELMAVRGDDRAAAAAHASEYAEWVVRMRRDVRRSTGPVVPRQRPGGWT